MAKLKLLPTKIKPLFVNGDGLPFVSRLRKLAADAKKLEAERKKAVIEKL